MMRPFSASLFLAALPLLGNNSLYTVNTVAGSNFVGDGGPAKSALLIQPEGIAADLNGNVYVADAEDHRVRRISPDGTIRTVAGIGAPGFSGDGGPGDQARLNTPYGIAVDRLGNIYIADLSNARVRRLRPDGIITTIAGGGTTAVTAADSMPALAAKLGAPRNVAVDAEGNIYISDFSEHRVLKVSTAGTLSTFAGNGTRGPAGDKGSATAAQLAYPAGLAVDRQGVVYIADSGNKRVRRVYRGIITTVGDQPGNPLVLDVPTGLAVDSSDNLYIADGRATSIRVSVTGQFAMVPVGGRDIAVDATNTPVVTHKRIVKRQAAEAAITIAGSLTGLSAGDGGPGLAARLNGPVGVVRDMGGNLYIGDAHNRRIRVVDPSGQIRLFVSDLDYAPYLAMDSKGNLYLSEQTANRIRRIAPSGAVTTFAGSGQAGFSGDGGAALNAQLSQPTALAVDLNDTLYIADTGNHRIRRVTADGRIATVAGGGAIGDDGIALAAKLAEPAGLAVDKQGTLYISEAESGLIRKVTGDGRIQTIARNLNEPRGLDVAENGELYIAETGANVIRRLDSSGEAKVIAGTGARGFDGEGTASLEAVLNSPMDIMVDYTGTVWFSDTGNHRIRKLSPIPVTTPPQPPPTTPLPPAPVTEAPKNETIKILHGATLQEQHVAPGQIVSIFGSGLGPPAGLTGKLTERGVLETEIAGTRVQFDGAAAPLFYVQDGQINAQVPQSVYGRSDSEVAILRDGKVKVKSSVKVRPAAPGLLTREAGRGQVVALNENRTVNAPENPATRGSVVTLYATGDGTLGLEDGRPAESSPSSKRIFVEIGGHFAELLYAGRAPGFVGLMQINLQIPFDLTASGIVPVRLVVDGEPSQNGTYLHVR